jgi:hypothetical protein
MIIIKRTWVEDGELREEEIDPRDFYILPTWWQRWLHKIKIWLRHL